MMKKTFVSLMGLLLLAPMELKAQKEKDFLAAMQDPKTGNGTYCLSLPKDCDVKKLEKKAQKWNYKIISIDRSYNGKAYFLPVSEYDAWLKAQDVLALFNQYPARANDLVEKHPKVNSRIVDNFRSMKAIDAKSELVNKRLNGMEFNSTGSLWFYEPETKGLELMQNAKWTGKVSNGMIEGSGDGYLVIKDKNGENVYRSFSGTFKNGFPFGDVTYAILYPSYNDVHVEYARPIKKSFTYGDFHDGLAYFREYSWRYMRNMPDEKRWTNDYGFIDPQGRIVIGPQYSQIKQEFNDGKAVVVLKGVEITINKEGKDIGTSDNVTVIPEGYYSAYSQYKNKKLIKLPSAVQRIERKAFESNPSVEEIILPEGLSRIGYGAFMGCRNLKKINIPKTVYFIGDDIFERCDNLTSVTIPASHVNKFIGRALFRDCQNLVAVDVVDDNGNITKDSSWYWKLEMTPEERKAIDEARKKAVENTDNFKWPDKNKERAEGYGWPGLLEYDLGLRLDKNWRAQKKRVNWLGEGVSAIIVRIYRGLGCKDEYVFYLEEADDYSPIYTNYKDVIAGAYFYYTKKKLRIKGLKEGEKWLRYIEKKCGYK